MPRSRIKSLFIKGKLEFKTVANLILYQVRTLNDMCADKIPQFYKLSLRYAAMHRDENLQCRKKVFNPF